MKAGLFPLSIGKLGLISGFKKIVRLLSVHNLIGAFELKSPRIFRTVDNPVSA